MRDKLISIIVPVFNSEKYLERCLQSIVSQTYSNVEILVIDDGSTDGSSCICKKYQGLDERVRYFYQENKGAAAARNFGLEQCHGEYIGFVDSDDYVDNNMYETLINVMNDFDADICRVRACRVDAKDNIIKGRVASGDVQVFDRNTIIRRYMLGNHSMWVHLYKTSLFDNLRFDEGVQGEDLTIIIPLYSRSSYVCQVNLGMYYYRVNPESVTHKPIGKRSLDILPRWSALMRECGDNKEYMDLIIYKMTVCIMGIINDSIMNGDKEKEEYANAFLEEYWSFIKKNMYVNGYKVRLYHTNRCLYTILLKMKRLKRIWTDEKTICNTKY